MSLSAEAKVGIWAIVVAIIIGISALFIPEFRQILGLENLNKSIEKVNVEPSNLNKQNNLNVQNSPSSNTNNVNKDSFSNLQQTSAQEVIGLEVIATDFDVSVTESSTIINIPFKLKDEDAKSGRLYNASNSYLADPNGNLYNLIAEGGDKIDSSWFAHDLRQHEIYRHKLVFQRLKLKPQFLFFHYNGENKFPPIKIMLIWVD